MMFFLPRNSFPLIILAALVFAGCHPRPPVGLAADAPSYSSSSDSIKHVVHISVDGLRADAVVHWLDKLPAYRRLRTQGAYTDNARTTPSRGNTLPNHTSQLTGRVVAGPQGHGWATNSDPDTTVTIHSNKGAYVASVFDVTSAAGVKAALFTSKEKFAIYQRSYTDFIDTYVFESNTNDLTSQFVKLLQSGTYGYAFLHLRNPDTAGHRFGWRLWSWHPYGRAVRKTDRLIGQVLAAIDADPNLRGKTAVIVTADHGGHAMNHGHEDRLDYTIPFYVWGPGIPAGELYDLAGDLRTDPGDLQIADSTSTQPIRNGDAANLALSLLNLNPVPGSTLNADRSLLRQPAALQVSP